MYSAENEGGRNWRSSQRHDAVLNYLKAGGMHGAGEAVSVLAAVPTTSARSTRRHPAAHRGIEPFLTTRASSRRRHHGRPVIEPAIVFANLLVPGQELAVHTDVPEFRGANRKIFPQWLLVVMHHSRLFDRFRMPIATGVSWYHDAKGGEFAFYPDGAEGAPVPWARSTPPSPTPTAPHGVDRVRERPRSRPGRA
jgi:hypothetical protein